MNLKCVLSLFVLLTCANSVPAAVSIDWQEIDNQGLIPGFQTYDLIIETDAPWCCNAMYFRLSEGTFYQDPAGTSVIPNPLLFDFFPTLEFDTYLSENENSVGAPESAWEISGIHTLLFDTSVLNISWVTQTAPTQTTGLIRVARITISEGAVGQWDLLIATSEPPAANFSGTVEDIIPEPGAFCLFSVIVLGVCSRRSRRLDRCVGAG